ncbi:MAG: hypothetical protein EBT07_04675 [Actinobacteria bacterium]|nr:hypothetical protein [Actinomycetota bacterium]
MAQATPLPKFRAGANPQPRGLQESMRAQQVANNSGGRNDTGKHSPELAQAGRAMGKAGELMGGLANIGRGMDTTKFNRNQQKSMQKLNDAMGKAQGSAKNVSNLQGQIGTLAGKISALAQAGCEYAKQLADAEAQMKQLESKAKQAEADLRRAQDDLKRAQQDLKNALNPSNPIGSRQRQQDAKKANEAGRDASLRENASASELGDLQNQYADVANGYNSTLDQSKANASEALGATQESEALNSAQAQEQARLQNAYNEAGQAQGELRQQGKDLLNDMKDWNMVGTAGSQANMWGRTVEQFGNGEWWKASASSAQNTMNTLANVTGFSGTPVGNIVGSFLNQSIGIAGMTLEQGGNFQDFAQTFANATMGLNDLQNALTRVNNAVDYFDAGDNFMGAVELTSSIAPLFNALGVQAQTASLFTGALSAVSPFTQTLSQGAGAFGSTVLGEAVSSFEMAKAGGDFAGSLATGSTALPYAFAQGFGAMADGLGNLFGQNLGLQQELAQMRGEAVSNWSGIDVLNLTPYVRMPLPNVPTLNPPFDPNVPDSLGSFADPNTSSGTSVGGRGLTPCPVKKPPVGSIAVEEQ